MKGRGGRIRKWEEKDLVGDKALTRPAAWNTKNDPANDHKEGEERKKKIVNIYVSLRETLPSLPSLPPSTRLSPHNLPEFLISESHCIPSAFHLLLFYWVDQLLTTKTQRTWEVGEEIGRGEGRSTRHSAF